MFAVRRVLRETHDGAINCVTYNPHRREFYSASADNLIKCWDTETGTFVRTLEGHKGWVTHLLYLPSLRQLISCSIDGKLLCWMSKAGGSGSKNEKSSAYSLVDDGDLGTPIHCMAYCERRKLLITATDGTLNLYSVAQAEHRKIKVNLVSKVKMHGDIIRCLLIIDDRTVLTAGYSRYVGVYDLETEKRDRIATPSAGGHDGAIAAMTYDTHSARIITGGYDRTVKVWSMPPDGRLLQSFDNFPESVTGCSCEMFSNRPAP